MEVRRDHTATTVSFGEGKHKQMLVNGAAITVFGQITKYMAHLPLAFHQGPPKTVLVICFGMGTTYRSSLSWDVQTTAVELLPSVRDAFSFYFDDVPQVLQNPKGRIAIDDGRRFLKRNDEQYDVITVDPPPPAEAAGSSLLYSEEFYALIKTRLTPNGILQQWYGTGEVATLQAVARSLANSFPCVTLYRSVENWGFHFLASRVPLPEMSPENLVARLPLRATQDLMEWSKQGDLTREFGEILARQIPVERILSRDPNVRITDNQPFNEYFLIRRLTGAPRFL
jgi:spermidine synthase